MTRGWYWVGDFYFEPLFVWIKDGSSLNIRSPSFCICMTSCLFPFRFFLPSPSFLLYLLLKCWMFFILETSFSTYSSIPTPSHDEIFRRGPFRTLCFTVNLPLDGLRTLTRCTYKFPSHKISFDQYSILLCSLPSTSVFSQYKLVNSLLHVFGCLFT